MRPLNLTLTSPLPDLLLCADGTRAATAAAWEGKRRPEVLDLCKQCLFGAFPEPRPVQCEREDGIETVLAGIPAVREQFTLRFAGIEVALLVFRPVETGGPAPCLFSYNYKGNPSIHPDPGIRGRLHSDFKRGSRTHCHSLPAILGSGFAFATACYEDVERDIEAIGTPDISWETGVRRTLEDELPHTAWGSIGAWAWGEVRIVEALQTLPGIDPGKIFVGGLSRHGKASLWAAANDERIAGVISNGSCAAGASLVRHVDKGTETLTDMARFDNWFAPAYYEYKNREDEFPIDQHFLLALAAPRPLYIADSEDDLWADPQGEFMGLQAASPAYALYGLGGFENAAYPKPYGYAWCGNQGFQLRTGEHASTPFEWWGYTRFLKRCLAGDTTFQARNLWD
ncbi:MAG: alpha/beta hydrolase family protein [Kiritimatiellia bacterium]|jgi:hypothetical protein